MGRQWSDVVVYESGFRNRAAGVSAIPSAFTVGLYSGFTF